VYIGLLVRASAIRVASSDAEQGALSSRLVTQRAVYAVDGGRMDKFAQIVAGCPGQLTLAGREEERPPAGGDRPQASSSGLVLCVARQRQDCELLSFRWLGEGAAPALERASSPPPPPRRD